MPDFKTTHFDSDLSNDEQTSKLLKEFEQAITMADFELFKKLGKVILEKVGHFNRQDDNGNTALFFTSWLHNKIAYDMMKYLLENGADPNISNYGGNTPLHCLVWSNKTDSMSFKLKMISLLLAHGANINQKNHEGDLPQNSIFKNNDPPYSLKLIQFLFTQKIDLKAKGSVNITLLHDMARVGFFSGIAFLFKKGFDMNPVDDFGNTPLHNAVFWNQMKATQVLVKNKADINRVSKNGQTPLLIAFRTKNFEIFKFLLEKGATTVALDEKGEDLFLKKSSSPQIEELFKNHKMRVVAEKEKKSLHMNLPKNSKNPQGLKLRL